MNEEKKAQLKKLGIRIAIGAGVTLAVVGAVTIISTRRATNNLKAVEEINSETIDILTDLVSGYDTDI